MSICAAAIGAVMSSSSVVFVRLLEDDEDAIVGARSNGGSFRQRGDEVVVDCDMVGSEYGVVDVECRPPPPCCCWCG